MSAVSFKPKGAAEEGDTPKKPKEHEKPIGGTHNSTKLWTGFLGNAR
jgi:hypothetical protein